MKVILLVLLSFLISPVLCSAQRIVRNVFDFDLLKTYGKEVISSGYRVIKTYKCPDPVFDEKKCTCERKEVINEGGKVIKLIAGNNVTANNINYQIAFQYVNDSLCYALTEYKARYVDSLHPYHHDTIIKGKLVYLSPYKREANGNLIIKSELHFHNNSSLPLVANRYDAKGKLQEIYYPVGKLEPSRAWVDSVITVDSKTYYSHSLFSAYERHSYNKYSLNGVLLETSYIILSNNARPSINKTIYVYNDSMQLVNRYGVGADNIVYQSEKFYYQNGKVIKHVIDKNEGDGVEDEVNIYDEDGQKIGWLERSGSYPSRVNEWKSYFKDKMLFRTDYLSDGECYESVFLFYSKNE